MSADLRLKVSFGQIDKNIFDKVKYNSDLKVDFIRDTRESTFTMTVDLDDILVGLMSRIDFEIIDYTRSSIERAERAEDMEKVAELKRELEEDFSSEQIATYDKFNGEFKDYVIAVAKSIMLDLTEYDLEDNEVIIEMWL